MFSVTKKFHFSAGHVLTGHPGKCKHFHGHDYVLEVTVQKVVLDKQMMVIDFGDLKAVVNPLVEQLDHHFLIWESDPRCERLVGLDSEGVVRFPMNPTAESIAIWFRHRIELRGFEGISIRIWETETAHADLRD